MDRRHRTWMSPLGRLTAAGALLFSGCLGRGDVELLEANLRQTQDQADSYQRQLVKLHGELDVARAELEQLRGQLAKAGNPVPEEKSAPLSRVAGIQFHSMMTGGRDQDGRPGHDVLTAVLTPVDQSGDLVKLGGEIRLELLDLSRTGDAQRIGSWAYNSDESHKLWHSGFIASGFQFDLPLSELPRTGQAVLHGRLVTSDGRQFDTSCPVALAPGGSTGSPGELAPSENARPISATPRRARAAVQPASRAQAVEPAGFVTLDDPDENAPIRIDAAPVVKPVPEPIDLPGSGAVESTSPGWAGADEEAPAPSARPFPQGLKTSDNWTDETIPYLR